jgi:hypothetical protein
LPSQETAYLTFLDDQDDEYVENELEEEEDEDDPLEDEEEEFGEEDDYDDEEESRKRKRYPERRVSGRERKPPKIYYDTSVLEMKRKPAQPKYTATALLDRMIGDNGKVLYRARWEGYVEML